MREKAILSIIILLFSINCFFLTIKTAKANPVVVPISDLSLNHLQNKTYTQNFIQISFNYSIIDEPFKDHESMQTSVSYVLDGLESVLVSNYRLTSEKLPNSTLYSVYFQIHDLSDGSHTLFVHISATADNGFTTFADSSKVVAFTKINPFSSSTLAMAKEYINYTITKKNGLFWAKVEGKYPINILSNLSNSPIELPMIYPTPPNTTNINITLNGQELSWSNYTQSYPNAFHHTAIGEWSMIQCVIENVLDSFLLEIQYEHPVQQTNEGHVFLYDLNISPYLSIQNPTSTAYFTINFETDISNLQIFTTKTDTLWNPVNYATQNSNFTPTITTQITSKYSEPLLGDLVITFNNSNSQETPIFLITTILVLFLVLTIGLLVYFNKHRRNNP